MKPSNQHAAIRGQQSSIFFSLLTSHFSLFVCFLVFLVSVSQLHAQVGNNNPTGVSGIFNGQITSGCSYDPWTGSSHRTSTDVLIAGSVSAYPLALTRTSNSRNAWGNAFGVPGAWRHNYQWSNPGHGKRNRATGYPLYRRFPGWTDRNL